MEKLTAKKAREISGVAKEEDKTGKQVENILMYVEKAAKEGETSILYILDKNIHCEKTINILNDLGYSLLLGENKLLRIEW